MNVGKLKNLVTIEELVKSKDEAGGRVEEWSEFVKAWCSLRPVSGNEKWYSNERHAEVTHQILTRYIDGLKPTMRIVAKDRIFNIESVINMDEANKTLLIVAKEEV